MDDRHPVANPGWAGACNAGPSRRDSTVWALQQSPTVASAWRLARIPTPG
jgi:hypothetical protein